MEVELYLPVYSRSFRGGNTIFSPWRLSRFVTKLFLQAKGVAIMLTNTTYTFIAKTPLRSRVMQKKTFGGNVYYVTMQITLPIPECTRNERNLHCDVLHITTDTVAKLVLDDAIAAIQTSR